MSKVRIRQGKRAIRCIKGKGKSHTNLLKSPYLPLAFFLSEEPEVPHDPHKKESYDMTIV